MHSIRAWNCIHWEIMNDWCRSWGRNWNWGRTLWCGFTSLNVMSRSWLTSGCFITVVIFTRMTCRRWAISFFITINNVHCLADRVNFHDLHVVKANVPRSWRDFAFLAREFSRSLCIIIPRGVFLTDALFIFKSCGLVLTAH